MSMYAMYVRVKKKKEKATGRKATQTTHPDAGALWTMSIRYVIWPSEVGWWEPDLWVGWPLWTVASIAVLGVIALLVQGSRSAQTKSVTKSNEFKKFQYNYLFIYLVIMLSDWLQGTNMYTLYMVPTNLRHHPLTLTVAEL